MANHFQSPKWFKNSNILVKNQVEIPGKLKSNNLNISPPRTSAKYATQYPIVFVEHPETELRSTRPTVTKVEFEDDCFPENRKNPSNHWSEKKSNMYNLPSVEDRD